MRPVSWFLARTGVTILRHLIWVLMLCITLSACTATKTINDTLSSTTPGDWYTGDGLLKADLKATAFVTFNQANLNQNLASGRGEYLASMGVLLGVPSERQQAFFSAAQARYAEVAGQQSQDSAVVLALPSGHGQALRSVTFGPIGRHDRKRTATRSTGH